MTDLEITKLCAEAMGIKHGVDICLGPQLREGEGFYGMVYQPLHDDAQAMELVKKFLLRIDRSRGIPEKWGVYSNSNYSDTVINADLNRAICECVAKMQQAKK